MSTILVLYGTTDGHTAKVAQAVASAFRRAGLEVDLANARETPLSASPESYDAVVVLGSVHISNYQHAVKRWVRRHAAALNRMPTAFISVCLGILEDSPKPQREVREIMSRFLRRSGWTPRRTSIVAGALPYTRYGWLKKMAMRRIAARVSMDTDTTRDYEYTDWADVARFALAFAVEQGLAPLPALTR